MRVSGVRSRSVGRLRPMAEMLEARDDSVALEADINIDVVDADVTGGFDD